MSKILDTTLAENKARLVAYTLDPQLDPHLKVVVMLEREWEHIDARNAKTIVDAKNNDNLIQNPKADNVSYNGSWYRAGPLASIGGDGRSVTIREKLVKSTSSSEDDVGRQWSYTHAVNWGETRNVIVREDMTKNSLDNFLTTYVAPANGKFYSINVSRNGDLLWNVTVVERTGVSGVAQWDFPSRNGTGHKWWARNQPTDTFAALILALVDDDTPTPNSYSTDGYDIQHNFTPKNQYDLEDYTIVAIPRNVTWDFNDTSTHYYTYIQKQEKKPDGTISGGGGDDDDVDNPIDGLYWRPVTVHYEQKFSLTNTGAINHITGGMAGSEIKTRSSSSAYFVSIKIVEIDYGGWSADGLPVNAVQAPIAVP